MPPSFDEVAASQRLFSSIPRQVELARRLGLTPSAISNLKRRQRCTLELVLAAADITGKSVEWFLFGEAADGRNLRKDTAALSAAIDDATRRTAEVACKVRAAEQRISYGDSDHLRALLRLYEERLAALESWIRILELRLGELEGGKKGHSAVE